MTNIKIDDKLFAHAKYSTDYQSSEYITWDRSFIIGNEDLVIYTDNSLTRVNSRVKNKIGWLLESPAVSDQQHEWIKLNISKFDTVFTNNRDLLDYDERFKFVPTGGCWIKPEDQKMWDKTKYTSIIASNKNWTDGHQMRQSILTGSKGFDIYGRGHNTIDYKLYGLRDYMFSIVVENTKKDYYFTEKIIDCFKTGTIPIYWGCPSIRNFFEQDGILSFDNLEELKDIIDGLSVELYESKMKHIQNNFELSDNYLIAEDYMYEKYFLK